MPRNEGSGPPASACLRPAIRRREDSERVSAFVTVRDAHGSLVHIGTRGGECVGCIEAGLFEVLRALVLEETSETPAGGDRLGEGSGG